MTGKGIGERNKLVELERINKGEKPVTREDLDVFLGASGDELLRKFIDTNDQISNLFFKISDLEIAMNDIEEPEIIDDLAAYNQKRREMDALRELNGEVIGSSGEILEDTRHKCNVLIRAMQESEDIPHNKWIRCGNQGIQISELGYMMRPWSEIELLSNPYSFGVVQTSDYVIGGLALSSVAALLGMCVMVSWFFLITILPVILLIFSIGSAYQSEKVRQYDAAKETEEHFIPYV